MNDYYNLQKINNLRMYVYFFNNHNHKLECLLGLENIVYNIDYYDNLYYNSMHEFSNNLIENIFIHLKLAISHIFII